jgi:hypothetical protein
MSVSPLLNCQADTLTPVIGVSRFQSVTGTQTDRSGRSGKSSQAAGPRNGAGHFAQGDCPAGKSPGGDSEGGDPFLISLSIYTPSNFFGIFQKWLDRQ